MSNPNSLTVNNAEPLADYLTRYRLRTEQFLKQHFSAYDGAASHLLKAMQYSLFAQGKRIRPILAYASAEAVGASCDQRSYGAIDAAAAALECIHSYSLIHDDLPAMDNDELRRGEPTCHIAFDEGTAILAGDALQTEAFSLIAECPVQSATTKLEMIRVLAQAAGARGMVAGQMLDIDAVAKQLSVDDLEQIHRLKTGALIRASVSLGALATEQASDSQLKALDQYAQAIGLAFQVQDDILDVTGTTQQLGKTQGADASLDKPTYVTLLGLDKAQALAQDLHQQALTALESFDRRADPLRQISAYIVSRTS